MALIKARYRKLLAEWHPDTSEHEHRECIEMTRAIVSAYQTLMDYCSRYNYSFSTETVNRQRSPEQWWADRFGVEPLWPGSDRQK